MDHILKQEMDQLKETFKKVSDQVDKIVYALTGNDMTKDGGLIQRVIVLEKEKEILEKRIEVLEKEKGKSDIYIKIMWGLGGVICTGIIGFILSLIFKKY